MKNCKSKLELNFFPNSKIINHRPTSLYLMPTRATHVALLSTELSICHLMLKSDQRHKLALPAYESQLKFSP